MHEDVVLPLDLVPEMVLVPRVGGIVRVELFVRVPERNGSDGRIEGRTARVATVVVTEGAAGDRIDRRMPRGIELPVRPDDRVLVVDLGGAVVARARCPDAVRRREPRGGSTTRRRECHVMTGERRQQG